MTPDEAFLSIASGVISSLIAVLVIELARFLRLKYDHRTLRKVLALRSETCLVSAAAIQDKRPWALIGQREAHAFGYVVNLALRLGVEPEIIAAQDPSTRNPIDEFCVGGPLTNQRTAEILQRFLPQFEVELTDNARTTQDPARPWIEGFKVDSVLTHREDGRDFAFLAKVRTDFETTVHLVFGLTDVGVAAAAYFLYSQYKALARMFGGNQYFVCLSYSKNFGYKSVKFDRTLPPPKKPS